MKPAEPDVLVEEAPKLGLKPDEAAEVSAPLVVGTEGLKPKLGVDAAGCEGSVAGFSAVFGANRLVDDAGAGVEGLFPIALANMFDVAVAGALSFGVEAESCGVGPADASVARARLEGDGSRTSWLSSLTLRFVDKLDSLPVIPRPAARCFFTLSIFFLMSTACW